MPQSVINLPTAFYDMLPFLITAIILVISSIRKKRDVNIRWLGATWCHVDLVLVLGACCGGW